MSLPHPEDLQYNVAGLLKGTAGGVRSYEVRVPVSDLDQLDEGFDITRPLVGRSKLLRTDATVLVRFRGETGVRLECARCLEPFEIPLPVEFEEQFYPSIDVVTGRPMSDTGDDIALVIDEHHILDISEVVRQAILLALPLVAYCRPDCAGLCPICGINRNLQTCTCAQEDVDPRWQALTKLFSDE